MLFHSSQFSLNITLLVLMGIYSRVDIIMAHQCYVCGSNEISCDNFNPMNKSFIKDCPTDDKGCVFHINGNLVERSCEVVSVEECKRANDVEYCFCTENLCNGKDIRSFSDDEDFAEIGSGTVTSETPAPKNEKKINLTSHSSHLFHSFTICIPILTLLYN